MISYEPALKALSGYHYYMKVNLASRSYLQQLSHIEAICEDFCQHEYGLSLIQAAKQSRILFSLEGATNQIWVLAFNSQDELDRMVGLLESFNGSAFYVKNEIHKENLERFDELPWTFLPKEDPGLPTYWLYFKKTDEAIALIDKFVNRNEEVKSLQHLRHYVVCFNSDALLMQAKLLFPYIDKIEKLINVNELGDRLL